MQRTLPTQIGSDLRMALAGASGRDLSALRRGGPYQCQHGGDGHLLFRYDGFGSRAQRLSAIHKARFYASLICNSDNRDAWQSYVAGRRENLASLKSQLGVGWPHQTMAPPLEQDQRAIIDEELSVLVSAFHGCAGGDVGSDGQQGKNL